MAIAFTLFLAGLLTILLPCILPLLPIVLGVSIAGRSRLRPLAVVSGMLASFIGFTFLLVLVLQQFVELADYLRIGSFAVLLLFGTGFLTNNRRLRILAVAAAAFFFVEKGLISVIVAFLLGLLAMEVGGRIATRIQQLGTDVQGKALGAFGKDAPITAFIIGLTLGLVWVPCAGPALGFAFTLVREEPGLRALLLLLSYGLGTAVPLLAVGYGGQAAVHSVHALTRFTGIVKKVAGVLLITTAIALRFNLFQELQLFILTQTSFGDLGTRLEEKLFEKDMYETAKDMNTGSPNPPAPRSLGEGGNPNPMSSLPTLPRLIRAPEFTGLGPWHNATPFTLASRRGKVVLVDFWTYSCINCIRTLPYLRRYWDRYKDTGKFVLIGVHTPEFVFEKSEKNVADAIARELLTYPVAQDNEYGTWRAFANRYWPAKYLIDAEGYIRYTHFGEGEYEETDRAIRSLLAEAGVDVSRFGAARPFLGENETEEIKERGRAQTPETYLGARSWSSLVNAGGEPRGGVIHYAAPASIPLHRYALMGDWELIEDEHQVLRSQTGEIRMRFLGSEINLVLGTDGDPIPMQVIVDGKLSEGFTVDMYSLFHLWSGDYGEHEIVLRFTEPGVQAYAFTFGS